MELRPPLSRSSGRSLPFPRWARAPGSSPAALPPANKLAAIALQAWLGGPAPRCLTPNAPRAVHLPSRCAVHSKVRRARAAVWTRSPIRPSRSVSSHAMRLRTHTDNITRHTGGRAARGCASGAVFDKAEQSVGWDGRGEKDGDTLARGHVDGRPMLVIARGVAGTLPCARCPVAGCRDM